MSWLKFTDWLKVLAAGLKVFKGKKEVDKIVELKKSIEEDITQLRKLGKTQVEIAKELNVSINQVKYVIQKLLKAGKIERKRK